MIILFLFLSLFIGISIRYSIILGLIEAFFLLGFVIYRFSKKHACIALITILLGVGLSFIRFDFQKEKYQALVVEVKDNYVIVSSSLEKLYVYEKDHDYEVGDVIEIDGYKRELDFDSLESGFDFSSYLNKKGVYYQLKVKRVNRKFQNPIKIHQLKKKFLSHFDEDTSALIKQLLFGGSEDGGTTSLLREMHLIRIASTSGLFLGVILSLVKLLAIRIVKKEKYADLIGVVFLLVYSVFTYPRFVVMKYVLLGIMRWINDYLLKKKFNYLDLVSISGILFLLFDYHYAYQDSFLLAYFLPILILFVNGSFRKVKKFKKKLLITLIVNLAIIPFFLNFNNELSPLSIVFQIILSPLLILYYLCCWLSFLGIPIYSFMNGFTHFLNQVLGFFLPILFKIHGQPFTSLGTLLYEFGFITFLYFLSIKNKDVYKCLIVIFSAVNVLYFIPLKSYIHTYVSFINVGQGDSCLIYSASTAIMIDTGGNIYHDLAKENLVPFLKKNRIYDIDLLVTTHNDYDHNGAAISLCDNFKVKKYVTSYQDFPIRIGNITLNNYNIYPNLWNEDNDASLVVGFTIKDCQFLVTGDAPIKIEKEIIKNNPKLNVDILKVGHHGSNTSSDESFIKAVAPNEAVISCGKNNKYGHPHKSVLNLLEKYKIKVRRTDLEGTITYVL